MAWPFSNEYVTQVGTSISRVVDDKLLPDISKSAPVSALFSGADMAGTIMDAILNSFAIKVERSMRYARDDYYLGLPGTTFTNDVVGLTEVKQQLEINTGNPVTTFYSVYGFMNLHHLADEILENLYDYDIDTNEVLGLAAVKGSPVFVETVITESSSILNGQAVNIPSLIKHNLRPTPWINPQAGQPDKLEYDPILRVIKIDVHIAWDNGNQQEIIPLDITNYYTTSSAYQTRYTSAGINDHFTYTRLFIPVPGHVSYPLIDNAILGFTAERTFLPVVFLRQDFQDVTTVKTTTQYQTTNSLMNKYGLDFDGIVESIHAIDADDLATVDQSVMMFGIPIDTTNELGIRYLYEFWNWVYLQEELNNGVGDISNDDAAIDFTPVSNPIWFEDDSFGFRLNHGRLAQWDAIEVRGEVGDTFSEIIQRTVTVTPAVSGQASNYDTEITLYKFSKQINATTVREYRIGNMELLWKVNDEVYNINLGTESSLIVIPINLFIAKQYFSLIERDHLYSLALQIVSSSLIRTKLEWYETSFFQGVLAAIGIAIIIFSFGKGTPVVVAAYAKLTLAYGLIVGTIVFALGLYVFNFGVGAVFSLVAEELGAEAAAILSILALAVAAYGYQNNMSFAPNLLGLGTNLINASADQFVIEANKYRIESEEFELFTQEKYDELEKLSKELEGDFNIDPLELVGLVPLTIPGESPDNFYHRTTHLGNIGTMSLDFPRNYVEQRLALPSFNESVQRVDTNA